MIPAFVVALGLTIWGVLFRVQRTIEDSGQFRGAISIWSPFLEEQFSTPREVKRFVNYFRYQAVRFRGPLPPRSFYSRLRGTPEPPALDREPALVLLAILDRLGVVDLPTNEVWGELPEKYRGLYDQHFLEFGLPTESDWQRYQDACRGA